MSAETVSMAIGARWVSIGHQEESGVTDVKEPVYTCANCGVRAVGRHAENADRRRRGYPTKGNLPPSWIGDDTKHGRCLCRDCGLE